MLHELIQAKYWNFIAPHFIFHILTEWFDTNQDVSKPLKAQDWPFNGLISQTLPTDTPLILPVISKFLYSSN